MTKRLKDSELDWFAIETRYRAGDAARAIGRDVGIAHSRITRRAAKFGWTQDPAALKRERLKASFLGGAVPGRVDELLDAAVAEDRRDMDLGLGTARRILERIADQVENGVPIRVKKGEGEDEKVEEERITPGPTALKTLGAANLAAIETIRRIRELDDPDHGADVFTKEHRDAIFAAAAGS